MSVPSQNESWVIEEGDRIINLQAKFGLSYLTIKERLIYSLWVADYGLRNSGDLATAFDVDAGFKQTGLDAATFLQLPTTRLLFEQNDDQFKELYLKNFEDICNEIRSLH